MRRHGIIVALVGMLLTLSVASVGSVGAAESPRTSMDADEFTHDGFGASGHIKRMLPSRANATKLQSRWRESSEEARTPQVVVGEDSRVQVTDTTNFPYSAIAQLVGFDANLPEDTILTCTASYIGARVLLTAAHCLWNDDELDGWIDELLIAPGANGEETPFGVLSPTSLWIPDAYTTDSDPGSPFDYGLIVLSASEDVEQQTGSFELGILTTEELQEPNFNPTTAGYPGDKPPATQWISSEPAFTSVDDDRLTHNIDSVPGQSGSAVWRASDMAIVAVQSIESEIENLSIRLDTPIMYEFMTACQELGCQINHFLTDVPGDAGAYDRTWQRTDLPVASGTESRTWMWGPEPISKIMFEPYAEAPNGFRTVLYQEKSRMEITNPNGDPNSIWYVTNGLATVELMTGNRQLGDDTFSQHSPAEINVAGDGDDPNGPTYATFAGLQSQPPHSSSSDPAIITATVDRQGNIGDDPSLAAEGVTAAHFVPDTQHTVASVFWDFMNSSGTVWQDGQYIQAELFDNPYFATGFPVTEAYWANVRVGGTERVVLVQAFQRRVLTYTPGNPAGFEVEAGNVGGHYLQWLNGIQEAEEPGNGDQDLPPVPGDLIAAFDLSTGPEIDLPIGTGMPVGDAYRITNPPEGFLQLLAEGDFSDGYFTVGTRVVQPSGEAGASCLLYRADPVDDNPLVLENGYWFCLLYDGSDLVAAVTIYETTQEIIELGGVDFVEPYPSGADWHQITVAAQGSTFWFIVDDTLLGSIEHDLGPGSGQVGFLSFNFDSNVDGPNAIYEFRDLAVFGLAEDGGM